MSRLAKKPVVIPSGVTASLNGQEVIVKGPKGEIKVPVMSFIKIEQAEGSFLVTKSSDSKQAKANLGTMVAHLRNAFIGVSAGFSKDLEIQGVGFRAAMEGKTLVLNLGFVNPVKYQPMPGVDIAVEKNIVKVSGISKVDVGQAAAKIRSFKKPEPYKGKGIRYVGEFVKIKAGKKASS